MEKDEKRSKLQNALKEIEKEFGKGSVMILGEETTVDVEATPSGSLSLDAALGIGGYPKGRIIEIYGPESGGKTTLALEAIASCQKEGGFAAFIDAEHALDPKYARNLGVDFDSLILSQPDSGEQALEIMDSLAKSGAVDMIVVDSVAALVPEAEIRGDMGDQLVGAQARLMSQAMRKLSGVLASNKCTAIFINQIREKVGVMFGNPETTPGGRALKFFASVRMEVRKGDQIKDGDKVGGSFCKVKIVKNKVAAPFKSCEIELVFGEGISQVGELVDLGVETGVLVKSGAWYSYKGDKIGQGRESAKKFLRENEDMYNEIYALVREALKITNQD